MIYYKIDVVNALKSAGYTATRIRREHIISEGTLTYLRAGKMIRLDSLDVICQLLKKQPGDIIGWQADWSDYD